MIGLGHALSHSLSPQGAVAAAAPQFAGPLDAFTEGLALALLPFRGLSSYAGAGWRVRDSLVDNSEIDAGFDLETGDPVLPEYPDALCIRWWYDQSGNGNDLPQETPESQPYLMANELAGYPVARFDGADDEMSLDMAGGTERTVYMVVQARTNAVNGRAWDDSRGAAASVFFNDITGSYSYYITTNVVDPVGGVPQDWNIIALRYSSDICTPFVNDVAGTPFVSGAYRSTDNLGFTLGSGRGSVFGPVNIAARLTYDVAHDDATRQAVQQVLAAKLGITLS